MGGEGDRNPQSLRAKMTKFQTQTKPQLLEGGDSAKGQSLGHNGRQPHLFHLSGQLQSSRKLGGGDSVFAAHCPQWDFAVRVSEDAQGFSQRWTCSCRELLGRDVAAVWK